MVSRAERMELIRHVLLGTAATEEDPSALAKRAIDIANAVVALLEKARETSEAIAIFASVRRTDRPFTDNDQNACQRALAGVLSKLPQSDAFEIAHESGGKYTISVTTRGTGDKWEVVLDVIAPGRIRATYCPRKLGEALNPENDVTRTAAVEFDPVTKNLIATEEERFCEPKTTRSTVAVVADLVVECLRASGAPIVPTGTTVNPA